MSNRILVDPKKALGGMVCELAQSINAAQAMMDRIKQALDMMVYGTPADYPALAAELGLPDPGAGSTAAADLFALVSAAQAALDADILKEFVRRTDQG